jgi:hypothetical protein
VIPKEAVDAARAAAHDALVMWKWSDMVRDEEDEFFTAILEGAAPYLAVGAFEASGRLPRGPIYPLGNIKDKRP